MSAKIRFLIYWYNLKIKKMIFREKSPLIKTFLLPLQPKVKSSGCSTVG